MLQDSFFQLLSLHTNNQQMQNQHWLELKTHYTHPERYYHTLDHLDNMLQQLQYCKEYIEDLDTILFSLFYHDIVYDPLRQDNEEQSAGIAVKQLQALLYPTHKTTRCYNHILATKGHSISKDNDTNLFTDADLSILGSSWDIYSVYATNIRKEYVVYPDALYKSGRAKLLHHFLQMERIFKTAYFQERFEAKARENLQAELQQLL